MARYKIYGDYGYESEQLLEEFGVLSEAKRWAERYTSRGDTGGYNSIEVLSFDDIGVIDIHWAFEKIESHPSEG